MKKPLLLETIQEFIDIRKNLSPQTIGFVPTMGALHQGHASLLKKAREENDIVVLSIFVNPTQFNDSNDFINYPKTISQDMIIAENCGVDYVLIPNQKSIYPDQYNYRISENSFSKILCGQHRPGHFDGVLTVVMKLFNIVQPTKAYFGEKDFQQLQLIKGMVDAFFMNLEVIAVPTLRESSGLAMSSRNQRLTPEQQDQASQIYRLSTTLQTADEVQNQLTQLGFEVDYVKDIENRRFVAARLNSVRLIDNVEK